MIKLIILLICYTCISIFVTGSVTTRKEMIEWAEFKLSFAKSYPNAAEESTRLLIFQNNVRQIQAHNKLFNEGKVTFSLKINQFTDWSMEEYKNLLRLNPHNPFKSSETIRYQPSNSVQLPEQVDWRTAGAVTQIKDQGECGSCWSFSTTGALEGQNKIKNGKLVSLSEQNLIDCSFSYGDNGCLGGLMDQAFGYVRDYGIMTENSYPYTALDNGTCHFDASQSVLNLKSFVDLTPGSEEELQEAVATAGPISIAIDASSFSFKHYAGGVLNDTECGNGRYQLTHGVLVVGYGVSEDGEYYIVKNSFGTVWGEDGYVRMSRNKNNQCGIATLPSYPLL